MIDSHPVYIIGGLISANLAGLLIGAGLAALFFNTYTDKTALGLIVLGLLANIGAAYLLSR